MLRCLTEKMEEITDAECKKEVFYFVKMEARLRRLPACLTCRCIHASCMLAHALPFARCCPSLHVLQEMTEKHLGDIFYSVIKMSSGPCLPLLASQCYASCLAG